MGKTKVSPSNSGKKLVQARLPFKTLPSEKKSVEKVKDQSDHVEEGDRVKSRTRKNEVKPNKSFVYSDEKENSTNVEVVISDDENISDGGESSEVRSQEEPSTSEKQDGTAAPVSKKSLDFGESPKKSNPGKKRGRKPKPVKPTSSKDSLKDTREDGVINLSSEHENEADVSELDSAQMKSPQAKVPKRSVQKAVEEIKVQEDYDATLNLKLSDSETEMMNESKSEKRDVNMRSPLRKATRVTPSRKAKESKLETSVVLEVSDNAMDISAIEMKSSVGDDSMVNSTLDITDTEPETVSTPKAKMKAVSTPDQKLLSSGKKRLDQAARQKLLEEKEKQRLKEKEEREERRRKEKEQRDEQKRIEREKKEEQRRKEREEKEEQKRKEKEEKDEQRRKEKEEKEKKRLAEIEMKNEELRQKQEEKRKREEQKEQEKRKKDEERRKKEEEKEKVENKKRKEAEVFSKFFVQNKESAKKIGLDDSSLKHSQTNQQNFMPFRIKDGMKLAPLWRRNFKISEKENLDKYLNNSVQCKRHYLDELKVKEIKPRTSIGTLCEVGEQDDCKSEEDVQIISSDLQEVGETIEECKPVQTFRTKFLWFHANRRPPYYGTFRKKSNVIKPRRPFALDKKYFDYEVDSDDEWEEEEIGESLHGSEDEKEKESEDEYEVDNEFFVPHGHLSDEEIQKDEGFDDLEEDDEQTAEAQKEKMKILQDRFNQSIKKKTEKIQPRIVGIVWQDENGNRPESCSEKVWNSLIARSIVINSPIVLEPKPLPNELETNASSSAKKQLKIVELDEDDIKNLITLVHGNRYKVRFLINEFRAFVAKNQTAECQKEFTFTSIRNQMDKISKWMAYKDTGSQRKGKCWMVNNETLTKYGLENISLKNEWNYVTEPPKHDNKTSAEENATKDDASVVAVDKNQTATPCNIKKFTKVLTEEERVQKFAKLQKTLKDTPDPRSKSKTPSSAIKSKLSRSANVTSKDTSKVDPIEIINCDDSDTENDNNEEQNSAAKLVCTNKKDSPFDKFLAKLSLTKCQTSNDESKSGKVAINIETKSPSTTKVLQTTSDEDKVKKKRAILLSTPLETVVSEDVKKQFVSKSLSKPEADDVVVLEDDSCSSTTKTLAAEDDSSKKCSSQKDSNDGSENKRVASPIKEQPPVKKRAVLLSVPLGTVIPEDVKNNFVSQNLTKKRDEQQSNGVEQVKDAGTKDDSKDAEPTKEDTSKTSSSQKENNERTVTVTVAKRLASPLPEQPPVKKRAPLLSVPLGTVVPEDVKKDFISKSLKKNKPDKPAESSKQEPADSGAACNT